MTYTSTITEWTQQLGPAGISAIAIFSVLTIFVLLSLIKWLNSKARYNETALKLIDKARDGRRFRVNPVEQEFTKERFNIADIVHPITQSAEGKNFTDCKIFGPGTVLFRGECHFYGIEFFEVNFVPIKAGTQIFERNQVVLFDCEIRGGKISNLNILSVVRDFGTDGRLS